MMELSPYLDKHLPRENRFDRLLNCPGRIYREVKHRRTLSFCVEGREFFIKVHRGCGWREIFKDLFQFRLPIVSAEPEWKAIELCERVGIPTMKIAGRGLRGANPARRDSFLITEALQGMVSLEDLTKEWGGLSEIARTSLKRKLVKEVALLARRFHSAGMNHRDFYICHFLVSNRDWNTWSPAEALTLHLIDLHRVQIRRSVPRRWLKKDLAALLFSAMDCNLSQRDLLRFLIHYKAGEARNSLQTERGFWQQVLQDARNLYKGFHGKEPQEMARFKLGRS